MNVPSCTILLFTKYLQHTIPIYLIIYVFLQTFEAMRSVMLQKGNVFLEKMMTARGKIATKGAERLPDGAVSSTRCIFGHMKNRARADPSKIPQ